MMVKVPVGERREPWRGAAGRDDAVVDHGSGDAAVTAQRAA